MMSVGYRADDLFGLVQSLPFHRLAYPELGALLRAGGNLLLTVLQLLRRGGSAPRALHSLSKGNGPGLNSGAALERLIGEALAAAFLG